MRVIADRFLERTGEVVDLATMRRVHLVVSAVAEHRSHARWVERCEWLSALRHPAVASLVDYGTFGEREKFEAWNVDGVWTGSLAGRARVIAAAACFFDATARVSSSEMFVGLSGGCAVVIPSECDAVPVPANHGRPAEETLSSCRGHRRLGRRNLPAFGLLRPHDPRLDALVEIFTDERAARVVAAAVCLPPEECAEHVVNVVARAARLAGYVPIGGTGSARDVMRHSPGRSLVLIVKDAPAAGWRRLLDAALSNPSPHIVVFVGHRAVRCVYTTGVRFWSERELVDTVHPRAWLPTHSRRVRAAARRAAGAWSRFERLLFRDQLVSRAESRSEWRRDDVAARAGLTGGSHHSRAAEPAVAYGSRPGTADATGPHGIIRPAWPASSEMARLKHQLKIGQEALARGRHTVGERWLRQAVHALARRGVWALAADGALCLARAVRDRGRLADVIALVDLARPWAVTADTAAQLVSLAVLKAEALFEQGRFLEAESLFDTAFCAALSSGEGVPEAALASARCLFWQGRYADAWRRLASIQTEVGCSPEFEIPWLVERCHVALGRRDVATAVAAAARARDMAKSVGNPSLLARALLSCALAQQAAGDDGQADASAHEALAASRKAHAPLLGLRARGLRAEIARRQGRRAPALLLVKRVGAAAKLKLPLTAAAPLTLLHALLDARGQTEPEVERCVDSTGLGAIRLFAPPNVASAGASSLLTDDIVELLRCCQAAQEDVAVLTAVCGRLRERLMAAGTSFYGCDQGELVCVAADGVRVDGQTARRVHTANTLVLPRCGGDRIEGGLPVRYAGQVVGVLAVRWTAAASWRDADVSLLLTTGAAAAAPALAGALARRAAARLPRAADVLGVSRAVADVRSALERAAGAPFPVLILGESGSGKELAARMLHKLGPRRDRPFCAINCAALPDDLLETELFGHARGAFTGAASERRGVFEEAHSGTLFLDEVGELSPRAQAKLLRAVQEGEIRRLGENVSRRVDVRVVTATNRDLRKEAAAERFRLDLLYRLDVIRIALPPLRERPEDIPVLVDHFWRDASERVGSRATLSGATVASLARYRWPGNIRELQNVLAALAVRAPRRGVIGPSALPAQFDACGPVPEFRLDVARQTFDRSFIRAALVRSGGQRSRAAQELGLSRQGLAKLMSKLGITDEPGTGSVEAAG